MPDVDVRPISAAETRPLRHAVLRPGEPPEVLVYPGDDAPETFHLGAFADGALVGIATYYRKPLPGEIDAGSWQLRGMATRPELRGRGFGRALLEHGLARIAAAGGARLWCNARASAAGFYRTCGFAVRGEPFELPKVGPHYLMWRPVAPERA